MPRRTPLRQEQLRRSLRVITPLKKGLDLLPEHVIITDPHANILYANEAAERASGFSVREMIGKNPGDVWGGHMPKSYYRTLWRTIKTLKKPFAREVKNRRKDGQIVWQDLRISPILDAKRRVRFFIAVESRATGRKREEQFRDELLSIIGHDSLSPVTVIRWTMEMLLESGSLTPKQRRAIEEVAMQNNRLVQMIEDMIFLSRLSGYPSKEHFDLVIELQHLLAQLQEQYPGAEFLFRQNLSSCPLVAIRSSALELCAILLKHAAQSMGTRGGQVTVTLRKSGAAAHFSCSARVPRVSSPWTQRAFIQKLSQYLGWGRPSFRRRGAVAVWSVSIPVTW